MLLVRYRIGYLQDQLGTGELDTAIRQRQAEGVVPAAGSEAPATPVSVGSPLTAVAQPAEAAPVREVVR
jgi:hypothetical protein